MASTETSTLTELGSNLTSSTGSLSSSQPGPRVGQVYNEASQLFLTRRIGEAYEALQVLLAGANGSAPIASASRGARIKVWSLYISILNEIVEMGQDEGKAVFGASKWKELAAKVRDGSLWEDVVLIGYAGAEGSVDADVVSTLATLLLTHATSQKITQQRLEAYLAASGTPILDVASAMERPKPARSSNNGTSTPRDLNSRLKIMEIYALYVLPRNEEWDYAREFINTSEVLDEEKREAFLQALQGIQDEQSIEAKREAELQRQRDQQMQDTKAREAQEKAARKAKQEAEEKKAKDAVKAADRSKSTSKGALKANTGAAASSSRGPSAPQHARKSSANGKAASTRRAPSTLASRASAIIAALQRVILSMGSRMRANPAIFLRLIAFVVALLLAFARRDVRDRVVAIRDRSWDKIKATVGMGVKVSYM